jgi:hypothetical protein
MLEKFKFVSALFKINKMKIKNYTTHTNENEISTHEETFGFTRASLCSIEKHTYRKINSRRLITFSDE